MVFSEGVLALATGMFLFLQILYYDFIGFSPGTIGIIFSIGSLFTLVGFFIGPFIKIIGRKNLLCGGLMVLAIGIIIHMSFSSLILIILGQILVSVGISLIQLTELQLIYSYTTGQKECCAYSYKCSVNFMCGAVGAIIGGNINRVPLFSNVGYRKLFFVCIVLILITCAIRHWLLPKEHIVEVEKEEVKKSIRDSVKFLRVDKNTQLFAMLLFITTIGFSGVGPYNNLILKDSFHMENNAISYITFAITILSMVGIILMPRIIEKIGVGIFNVIIFIVAIMGCFTLATNLKTQPFIVILMIRGIFALLIVSSLDSLMMSNIDLEHRDVFAAVKMLVSGISLALGNFIGGWILNNCDYKGNYLYGGFILICGVTFFYVKVKGRMVNRKVNRVCSCHFKSRPVEYKRQ